MDSRMTRYYRSSLDEPKRSDRNQNLYEKIYKEGEYSNIEGITNIEKTNEIDINKIREMLREKEIKKEKKEVINYEETSDYMLEEEEKSYDIRDILNKAKDNRQVENNEIRSLKNTQYDILKSLKIRDINDKHSEDELKDLIHTITNTSILNKMEDKELSLNMFSDLKSSGDTIYENIDVPNHEETFKEEIDKSFYTSSLNFNEEDFEELKDINSTLKKNNVLIKVLLILLFSIIIVIIIYLVYMLMGKNGL